MVIPKEVSSRIADYLCMEMVEGLYRKRKRSPHHHHAFVAAQPRHQVDLSGLLYSGTQPQCHRRNPQGSAHNRSNSILK